MQQILTPTGYKNIATMSVGDEVTAIVNGQHFTNIIEKIELWDVNNYDYGNQGDFTFYVINDTWKLFKNQSVWADDRVVHAKDIVVGNTVYDENDNDVQVVSVKEITDGEWWRMTISGDHSYVLDGLTLHNSSRFWVKQNATANWNQTAPTNWGSSSGTSDGASVPSSSDDVTQDGAGGAGAGNASSTISATITVLSYTVTSGYTATTTHNAVLTIAGNWTLGANYTIAGASGITISASSTITSNGKTWPNSIIISTSSTITLNSLLTVTGTLTVNAAVSPTFAGTAGFTVGTFTNLPVTATTITLVNGVTYTITTALNSSLARTAALPTFTSDHATLKAILTLANGATCNTNSNFTRIDASNGRAIWTWNGTATTCNNIFSFTDIGVTQQVINKPAVGGF